MRVAVLTLTRDRLEYTEHCFGLLHELAGCDFDHYVFDQASEDGSRDWLLGQRFAHLTLANENVGINRGVNYLIDQAVPKGYDVIVKFDNDCELIQPDTLRRISELVVDGDAILSPRILGLNNPPSPIGGSFIGDEQILLLTHVGGIFLAAPAKLYAQGYRHRSDAPLHGSDDGDVCVHWRRQGGRVGYVASLEANHCETTRGQWERYPEYFQRTLDEGKPRL